MKTILINFALYLVAKHVKWLTEPIASIWTRFMLSPLEYSKYKKEIAIAEDQVGNVMYMHIFNKHLIKPEGYKFGNRKETISSAVGKNKVKGTLLKKGKQLDQILDKFEKEHSVLSVDCKV